MNKPLQSTNNPYGREATIVYCEKYAENDDDRQTERRKRKTMRLIEEIASKDNLNQAFLQVTGNKGSSGIDNMTCDEVKDYLKVHGQDLINQILSREYQPLPVRRVEIPKPNGGIRKLGIPTVVDRIVQQAVVKNCHRYSSPHLVNTHMDSGPKEDVRMR